MMMNRVVTVLGSAATAVILLATGCSYPNPPQDFMGTSYTGRQKTDADELLKGVTLLSLEQAQNIAIANNPSYIVSYYAIRQAQLKYYQAIGAYSPEISADFQLSQPNQWNFDRHNITSLSDKTNGFTTNTGVNATWLVFNGLRREFELKIASIGFDKQKALSENDCRLLIRSVAYAYNSVLLANENKRIATEDLDFQIKSLRDTELKYQAGAVPLSDVLNFRALANVAEGNYITAEYQYEIALYALAVLMGYPEGTLPPEVKFPPMKDLVLPDLPSVDIFLDNALANRPDLRAYREQLNIAQYNVYSAYSYYSPVVNAFANFGFDTTAQRVYNDDGRASSHYNDVTFTYGFNATWTIFNGFIRFNQVREAQAVLAASKYQVADAWLVTVQEVRNGYINFVQNVKQARLYEKTLEITTKQRDLVEDEYKAGNTELTRLNEAQRDLVDAQSNLASAYISVQNAKAQLDAAAAMNISDYTRAPAVFQDGYTPTEVAKAEKAQGKALEGKVAVPSEPVKKHVLVPQDATPPVIDSQLNPGVKSGAKPEAKPVSKPVSKPEAKPAGQTPAWNPDNLAI